jgi:oligopeptide transport system ATP-binding protein
MSQTLLEVNDVEAHFQLGRGILGRSRGVVRAVNGVSLRISQGQTLGLVGESGCGKSTLGRCIVGLERPTAGVVRFDGQPVGASADATKRRRVQMIFQDPYASLNPRMTAGEIVAEPIRLHNLRSGAAVQKRMRELLGLVELLPSAADQYPHEFSGGQRQRIGIARALACEPDLIVCDEPVSALDVSIQAQVMRLLCRLQVDLGITYLFIGHELGVVRAVSDEIAVMYLGQIVEQAESSALFHQPRHAYTRALISAAPIPDPALERTRARILLSGDPPNPMALPPGCPFSSRCPVAIPLCGRERPPLVLAGRDDPNHTVACWRADEMPALLPLITDRVAVVAGPSPGALINTTE